MKASEINIGNWGLYEGTPYRATIATIRDPIDFKPLPLTKRWLKRFDLKFKELGFEDLAISYGHESKKIHFVINNCYIRLDYVHELQNLYFLLTKHELLMN